MNKIIVAADSFKGSLSSRQIAALIERQTRAVCPQFCVEPIVISDGGEGLVDAGVDAGYFSPVHQESCDPYGRPIRAVWGIHQQEALIELAQCSGLQLCEQRDPSRASTLGTGLQIRQALQQGCRTIWIGLGGSGTHDGGCGIAAALGAVFLTKDGSSLIPRGANLQDIHAIDLSGLDPRLKQTRLICLCDVNNPAVGPQGAAAVFARQKGADDRMIQQLEQNTLHLGQLIEKLTHQPLINEPGTGAAGACGLALQGLLQARVSPGLPQLLRWNQLDQRLKDACLVVTGEGKIDSQSLAGKVPMGILRAARPHHVPVVALCGILDIDREQMRQMGFADAFSINPPHLSPAEMMEQAPQRLQQAWHDWFSRHYRQFLERC